MKQLPISKRLRLLAISGIAALLVVACGGGGSDTDAALQATDRARAQGILDKLPVSWIPEAVDLSVGSGVRQDVSVTLTTRVALKNAKIVFVPDLRNTVTVTPETIPALAAGQSATVTLTFAAAATDTRKVITGILLLFDKNATTSRPLPVKVSLVKPADWQVVPSAQSSGISIKSPPNWFSQYDQTSRRFTLKNTDKISSPSDEAFSKEAVIRITRRFNQNPQLLPIETWMSERLEPGLPTPVKSRTTISVSGKAGVRIVFSELGGDTAHIFIPSGVDVVEVAYGLFSPQFLTTYESILSTLVISDQL